MPSRTLALLLGLLFAAALAWVGRAWLASGGPAPLVQLSARDASGVRIAPERAPLASRTGLVRYALSEAEVARLFPLDNPANEYDAHTYLRSPAGLAGPRRWPEPPEPGAAFASGPRWTYRTNALGMRADDEVSETRPDLRVLVSGDSHADGVCENRQSFTNRLEERLARARPGARVECLNAAKGGFSFYSYLGCLERFLYLAPELFVVAIYGGNDFEEVLTLYHLFAGSARPPGQALYKERVRAALAIDSAILAQALLSCIYFAVHPEQERVAVDAARAVLLELEALAREHEVELVFVYLPSVASAQPALLGEKLVLLLAALELDRDALAAEDRMADALLRALYERELTVVDLRQMFQRSAEPLYWKDEWHIHPRAHELVAAALAREVERVLAR